MSYCRFSSDDYRSDVYVYDHYLGGIVIHVAGNKSRGWIPRLWRIPIEHIVVAGEPSSRLRRLRYALHLKLFMLTYRLQHWYLGWAPRKFYDLPFAGEAIDCQTYDEAIERLLELRSLGYWVPQHAIDRLIAEEAVALNLEREAA